MPPFTDIVCDQDLFKINREAAGGNYDTNSFQNRKEKPALDSASDVRSSFSKRLN
jgi:hypothetical protein